MESIISALGIIGAIALFIKTHNNNPELLLLKLKLKNELGTIILFITFIIFGIIYENAFLKNSNSAIEAILFYGIYSLIIFSSGGLFYYQIFTSQPRYKKRWFRTWSVIEPKDLEFYFTNYLENNQHHDAYLLAKKLGKDLHTTKENISELEEDIQFPESLVNFFALSTSKGFIDATKWKDPAFLFEVIYCNGIQQVVDDCQSDLSLFNHIIVSVSHLTEERITSGSNYIYNLKDFLSNYLLCRKKVDIIEENFHRGSYFFQKIVIEALHELTNDLEEKGLTHKNNIIAIIASMLKNAADDFMLDYIYKDPDYAKKKKEENLVNSSKVVNYYLSLGFPGLREETLKIIEEKLRDIELKASDISPVAPVFEEGELRMLKFIKENMLHQ